MLPVFVAETVLPNWIEALWPIFIFLIGLVYILGRRASDMATIERNLDAVRGDIKLLWQRTEDAQRHGTSLDVRLTAVEVSTVGLGRTMDRIEQKVDRLIEKGSP